MSDVRIEIRDRTDLGARQLEYDVFLEAGYISETPHRLVADYDKYQKSEFVTALSNGELSGMMRLIYADDSLPHRGLPTLEHYTIWDEWRDRINKLPESRLGEFGTLAVRKPYRKGRSTYLLKRKSIMYPAGKGYRYGLSLIDAGLLARLQAKGHILVQIGDSKYFMGSETVPVFGSAYKLPITLWRWTADLFRIHKKYS